ncbi:MAG: CPBP family intramembrane glutamic endopeptidase [Bryobacteraceae bacterium]
MSRSFALSAAAVMAAGWLLFALAGAVSKLFPESPPWLHQVALKGALAALAFAAIAVRGGPLADYGFRRAHGTRWRSAIVPGLAMGAAASFVILLAGGAGLRGVMRGYSFPAIVLVVWIGSSVSEEIFTRGWAQTALDAFRDKTLAGLPAPAVVSGLLFGSLHLGLLRMGIDTVTAIAIPVSTTLLGLLAGVLRHRSGSLWPAVAAHVAFNAGGMFGGIAWMLMRRAIDGKFPMMGA